MPRGVPISPSKRGAIVEAASHMSYHQVAARHGCSVSSVSRLVNRKQSTGSVYPSPRHGPAQKTTRYNLMTIKRTIITNRFLPMPQLHRLLRQQHNIQISLTTLCRILHRLGYKRRTARAKPLINRATRKLRRLYAKRHLGDHIWDWRRTIFCDELAIRQNDRPKAMVTRKDGEAGLLECTVPKLLGGKVSIMVWGAIYYGGRSRLWRFDCSESEGKRQGVTGKMYMEQITNGQLRECWKSMKRRFRGYGGPRIVEDNAPIHSSKVNRLQAVKQGFTYLAHPPSSPDLNPIENVWSYFKMKVANRHPRPTTADALFAMAQEEWDAIPQYVIDHAVDSMNRRLKEVRKRHGHATKY